MAAFQARSRIAFPDVDDYISAITDSVAAHGMHVVARDTGYVASSDFGSARIQPVDGALEISIEAQNGPALNRIRHSMTGLIDFVAHDAHLDIDWSGDEVGATYPPDLRILTVADISMVTPNMKRVVFRGDDLRHLADPEQIHCRLLLQQPDTLSPAWPTLNDRGRIDWPESGKLVSRVYTIREIDCARGTLTIDFFIHKGRGAALDIIKVLKPGDSVGILGPAAHGPRKAEWFLLAGDETGLPGIARILSELPPTARGVAIIECTDDSDRQPLAHPQGFDIRWLSRPPCSPSCLSETIAVISWPDTKDDAYFWGGYEYQTFRTMRRHLRNDVHLPATRQASFAHWRQGMSEDDIVAAGGASVAE